MARIRIDGESYYLGYYYDQESASTAYMTARRNAEKGILPNGRQRTKSESQ